MTSESRWRHSIILASIISVSGYVAWRQYCWIISRLWKRCCESSRSERTLWQKINCDWLIVLVTYTCTTLIIRYCSYRMVEMSSATHTAQLLVPWDHPQYGREVRSAWNAENLRMWRWNWTNGVNPFINPQRGTQIRERRDERESTALITSHNVRKSSSSSMTTKKTSPRRHSTEPRPGK